MWCHKVQCSSERSSVYRGLGYGTLPVFASCISRDVFCGQSYDDRASARHDLTCDVIKRLTSVWKPPWRCFSRRSSVSHVSWCHNAKRTGSLLEVMMRDASGNVLACKMSRWRQNAGHSQDVLGCGIACDVIIRVKTFPEMSVGF